MSVRDSNEEMSWQDPSESDRLEFCLECLASAKTDDDIFASLFLVNKVLKAENCDGTKRRKIFEALGFKFIHRLLKTASVPEDCSKNIFKSLAINLLTSLCMEEPLITDPGILDLIPYINQLLTMDLSNSDDPSMDKEIIDDCMNIIVSLEKNQSGQMRLFESGTVNALVDVYCNDSYGAEKSLQLIIACLSWSPGAAALWQCNTTGCVSLLNKLAAEFRQDQDSRKFQLCDILTGLVSSLHGVKDSIDLEPWSTDVYHGLSDILKSKIGGRQRDPALKLGAAAVDCFGVKWCLHREGNKFFKLLVYLASVEVRMILESGYIETSEFVNQSPVLTSCYILLERTVSYLSSGEEVPLEGDDILQMKTALTEALNAVLFFLDVNSQESVVDRSMIIASVRVLGAWLAEETASLREEVYGIIPFLLKISQETLIQLENPADVPCKEPTIDLLRFLLPGLCHLSAEDAPRQTLIENEAHSLLEHYFAYHWNVHVTTKSSESVVALTLLCGVFLNFAVTEPSLVSTHPAFLDLTSRIVTSTSKLVGDSTTLTLLANMTVLGLMFLRHTNKHKCSESDVCKFLSTSCTFLRDAHTAQGDKFCVSKAYREVWEDVAELWYLGMQELCHVIPKYVKLSSILIDNGWIISVLRMFQNSKGNGADGDALASYDHLLSIIASQNDRAKGLMKSKNGLETARLCKMLDFVKTLER